MWHLILATSSLGLLALTACHPARPTAAAPARLTATAATRTTTEAGSMETLRYFVGTWSAQAKNPSTGQSFTLDYRVEEILGGRWLAGHGLSPELGLEVRDVWGIDPMTGEITRTIFDSQGTHGVVRSRGWEGDTLRLEGEARAAAGAITVREIISRISATRFRAVWESKDGEIWTPYSVEELERTDTVRAEPDAQGEP